MSSPNADDYEVAEGLVDAWQASGRGYLDLSERIAQALAEARDRATGATTPDPPPPPPIVARARETSAGPWFQARCEQCGWFEEVPFQAREDADAVTARHMMREHSPRGGARG